MRALILKVVLLLLPFAAVAGVVAAVDPFGYFAWSPARPRSEGTSFVERMSPTLWKLAAYRRDPAPNILLGDSRMASLSAAKLGEMTGERIANLGYGGASLDESIRTFWYADGLTRLRSATFGVNLDLYSETNAKDRVSGTLAILSQPGLYLCDRLVLRTTWGVLQQRLTGHAPTVGVPAQGEDAFWRYQLDVTARVAYETWREPEGYRRRLREVADHCRRQDIALRFVIFPEHADLQERAARFGLAPQAERMRAELRELGDVRDLSDLVDVHDRSLFIDPYHFSPAVEERILERLR